MKKTVFTGCGTAIITPMDKNGAINYPEMERLINFQLEEGIDSIVVCGTTGEASSMNDTEHLDVIEFVVNKVNGKVPVIAGAGSNDTRHAINLSKEAEKRGADALLHVTPYYNKTNQSGLIRHFTVVADSINIPIILYNVPSRTGMSIAPETYLQLCEHENIVATKEASGNFSAIAKTAALCGDKLDIYSGNDDQIVPLLSLGAKGVISVISNILPKQTHEICKLYSEGKTKASLDLQLKYISLIEAMFCDVNPIPVKEAVNLFGYDAGKCRLPLGELSEKNIELIKSEMKKFGVI